MENPAQITEQQVAIRLKYLIKAATVNPAPIKLITKVKPPRKQGLQGQHSAVVSDSHGTFEVHIFNFEETSKCSLCNETVPDQEIALINRKAGSSSEQLWIRGSSIHLAKKHSVAIPSSSKSIIDFLELKPGIDYSPAKEEIILWKTLEVSQVDISPPTIPNYELNTIKFYYLGTEKLMTIFDNLDLELSGYVMVNGALLDLDDVDIGCNFFERVKVKVLSESRLARDYRKFSAKS